MPSLPPLQAPVRTVLMVEDEPTQAALLRDALESEGYPVVAMENGSGVAEWVRANDPAVVLLDLVMPGKDGLTVCREIRTFSTVPIIMITGRVEEIDRLLGLEMGADDYICKPFHPREVVARVRALLRRAVAWSRAGVGATGPAGADATAMSAAAGLALDEERFEARWNGVLLDLTPVEFRLLKVFSERQGRVLSRNQLLDAIYTDNRIVSDRTVDSHIKNLRRKIGESCPGVDPVESVYGVGYKFVLP